MKVKRVFIKLFDKFSKIPTSGSLESAGLDLYANLGDVRPMKIAPGEMVCISTGLATKMPKGTVGLVFSRSGIVRDRGLCVANGVGVIDSDYRGEWKILLRNCSNEEQTIINGERVAQVVFLKYQHVVFFPTKELEATERGEGGFGSTGRK